MKRSDKYRMVIELKQSIEELELFNTYQTLKPYKLMWHKDNDKHSKAATVYITDIAPPVTPEIDTGNSFKMLGTHCMNSMVIR